MNTRTVHIVLVLAALAAFGCQKKAPESSGEAGRSAIDTAQLAPGAAPTAQADSAVVDTAGPLATHVAVISTSLGDIEIELYGKDAPKTVENFVGLAGKKYYDGVAFHRVVPAFMIQTGDPNSRDMKDRSDWGMGGESFFGGTFADELDPATPSYRRGYVTGAVAMANSGPNTNGSQFFIVLSTQGAAHLQHAYTIFGHVRSGMDVVEKIGQTGMSGENPVEPAILKTVTVKPVAGQPQAAASKPAASNIK